MSKRPLAVIALYFIVGIILGGCLPADIGFHYLLIATLFFILISFIFSAHYRLSNIALFASVASFAALLYLNAGIYAPDHISTFLKEEKLKTDMVGIIKSPALTRKPYYGKINSTYLLEIEGIKTDEGWMDVTGLVQVRIQTEKDYKYGDRLFLLGTIRKPALPEEKGDFNYREYLERQNIFAVINTKENNVTLLAHDYRSNPILKYIYLVRAKLKNQILEKMPLESGAFLRAILLGDRSELPKHIQESFKNSGTVHILAISGLHVGLIALIALTILRFLGTGRIFSYGFTILFLVFFATFTLSRPSVMRATVMACIFLTGMLLGRRTDAYNSLGAAALFILIKNPKDLFNVGFQLSFLAVFSILYLVPRLKKMVKENGNFYLRRYVYMPSAVSIAAWLGTFPLILYYFKIITPIAVIANLFIIPVLFVLLAGGLSFILVGWAPFLGDFLAGFNNVCANIMFSLADFFASIKFGHFHF